MGCYNACIISLTNFFHNEVEAVYYDILNYEYLGDQNLPLGKRINPNSRRLPFVCEELYSLRVEIVQQHSRLELWERMLQLLTKKPVLLQLSSFNCPWLSEYQREDRPHFIIGTQSANDLLFFYDPSLNTDLKAITHQEFNEGIQNVFEVYTKCPTFNNKSLIASATTAIASFQPKKSGLAFLNDLTCVKDFSQEYKDIQKLKWSSLLNISLNEIAESRRLYQRFLNYLKKKYDFQIQDYQQVISGLENASNMWFTLRGLIYKDFLEQHSRYSMGKIVQYMKMIINIESEIKNNLERVYHI